MLPEQVTDDGLKHLVPMPELGWLDLSGTAISDGAIRHIRLLKSLKKLDIWDTQISLDGETLLRESLPNCRIAW